MAVQDFDLGLTKLLTAQAEANGKPIPTPEEIANVSNFYIGREREAFEKILSSMGKEFTIDDIDDIMSVYPRVEKKSELDTQAEDGAGLESQSVASRQEDGSNISPPLASGSSEFVSNIATPQVQQDAPQVEQDTPQAEKITFTQRVKEFLAPVTSFAENLFGSEGESTKILQEKVKREVAENDAEVAEGRERTEKLLEERGGDINNLSFSEYREYNKYKNRIDDVMTRLEQPIKTEGGAQRGMVSSNYYRNLGMMIDGMPSGEVVELFAKLRERGDFDKFTPAENENWIDKVGELFGSQMSSILLGVATAPLGGVGAAGGALSVAQAQGATAKAQSASGYLAQAEELGLDPKKAIVLSDVSKKHSWVEGFIGALPIVGKGKTLSKIVLNTVADAGVDGIAAGMLQAMENNLAKAEDFPVETWDGAIENAASEVAFSLVMNAVGLGGAARKAYLQKIAKKSDVSTDLKSRIEKEIGTGSGPAQKKTEPVKEKKKPVQERVADDYLFPSEKEKISRLEKKIEKDKAAGNKDGVNKSLGEISELQKNAEDRKVNDRRRPDPEKKPEPEKKSAEPEKKKPEPEKFVPKSKLTEEEQARITELNEQADKAISKGDDGQKEAEDAISEIGEIKRAARARKGDNLTDAESQKIEDLKKEMQFHLRKNDPKSIKEGKKIAKEIDKIKEEAFAREELSPEQKKGREMSGQQSTGFFSEKAKNESSKVPYKPVLTQVDQNTPVGKAYSKYTKGGKFTGHISKMIAGFQEKQKQVAEAIVKGGFRRMLDIGSSEGGLIKTVASQSKDMKATGIDPNDDMIENFNSTEDVPNAKTKKAAWQDSWVDDNGNVVPEFKTDEKFDIVNEDFSFQFMEGDRGKQVDGVKSIMTEDGVFVTSEKFHTKNEEANETKKLDHQKKYFSDKDLKDDKDGIISDMDKGMVEDSEYESILRSKFKYVEEFWNAGNFKGYIASDSKQRLTEFKNNVGDLSSEFSDAGIGSVKKNFTERTKTANEELSQATEVEKAARAEVAKLKQRKLTDANLKLLAKAEKDLSEAKSDLRKKALAKSDVKPKNVSEGVEKLKLTNEGSSFDTDLKPRKFGENENYVVSHTEENLLTSDVTEDSINEFKRKNQKLIDRLSKKQKLTIGFYGHLDKKNSSIDLSLSFKTLKNAIDFARKNNQESIYDVKNDVLVNTETGKPFTKAEMDALESAGSTTINDEGTTKEVSGLKPDREIIDSFDTEDGVVYVQRDGDEYLIVPDKPDGKTSVMKNASEILESTDPKFKELKKIISENIGAWEKGTHATGDYINDIANQDTAEIEQRVKDRKASGPVKVPSRKKGIKGAVQDVTELVTKKFRDLESVRDLADKLELYNRYFAQGDMKTAAKWKLEADRLSSNAGTVLNVAKQMASSTQAGLYNLAVKGIEDTGRSVDQQTKDKMKSLVKEILDVKKELERISASLARSRGTTPDQVIGRINQLHAKSDKATLELRRIGNLKVHRSRVGMFTAQMIGSMFAIPSLLGNIAGNRYMKYLSSVAGKFADSLIVARRAILRGTRFDDGRKLTAGTLFGRSASDMRQFVERNKDAIISAYTTGAPLGENRFELSTQLRAWDNMLIMASKAMKNQGGDPKAFWDRVWSDVAINKEEDGSVSTITKVKFLTEMVASFIPDFALRSLLVGDLSFRTGAKQTQLVRAMSQYGTKEVKNFNDAQVEFLKLEARAKQKRAKAVKAGTIKAKEDLLRSARNDEKIIKKVTQQLKGRIRHGCIHKGCPNNNSHNEIG